MKARERIGRKGRENERDRTIEKKRKLDVMCGRNRKREIQRDTERERSKKLDKYKKSALEKEKKAKRGREGDIQIDI